MQKINKKTLVLAILITAISVAIIIVTLLFAFKEHNIKEDRWIISTYGNSVALYKGDEVVEVYSSIVLDTLPDEDKKLLENGISFLTKDEAVMAIEDYDG